MGWFDKSAWQKRRKIKDLQGDLLKAERQGKYVVEEGLFFAELEDMGNQTMMLFGTSPELSGGEDTVIRSFFDRNGFGVDTLKLDRAHTGLADVEIIPPEEVTRWVGRNLKAEGYKLIDDSEEERPAELSRQILPLSSLVRSIVILFCERVQRVISTTRIKMNKEGNRLLHWLPKIREYLAAKIERETVEVVRTAFDDAFDQFYLKIGHSRELDRSNRAPTPAHTPSPEQLDGSKIPSVAFPERTAAPPRKVESAVPAPESPRPVMGSVPTPPPEMDIPFGGLDGATYEDAEQGFASGRRAEAAQEEARLQRALDVSDTLGLMYKHLIGANTSRCVRNAEVILEEVQKLFNSSATCIMVKVPNGHGLTIHAQAGKRLAWGEGGADGYPVSSTVLGNCLKQRTPVTNLESGGDPTASMISHSIQATAAAPIVLKNEIVGILYLDRRGKLDPFTDDDCESLVRITSVFREYPELTLGLAAG